MSDALIPDLEFRAPDCPLCDKETNCVDGGEFECEECELIWAPDGTRGSRIVDNEAQCTSEHLPYADRTAYADPIFDRSRDHRYRCLLTDGHKSVHRGSRCNPPDSYDIREWITANAVKAEATS